MLERALAFAAGAVIESEDLHFESLVLSTPNNAISNSDTLTCANTYAADKPVLPVCLPAHLASIERDVIRHALHQARFNRSRAASLLGISLQQLRYRMQRLTIHDAD